VVWAKAGPTAITIISATRVNNTIMRFILASPPLQQRAGPVSPAVLRNVAKCA
jgi:hypothetical protein